MKLVDEAKVIGGAVGVTLSRIIGYTVLGLFVTLAMAITKWDVITGNVGHWRSYVLVGACIALPVLYFLVGQKQGYSGAVVYLISKKKDEVIKYIVKRMFDKYPGLVISDAADGFGMRNMDLLGGIFDGLPWLSRRVLSSFSSVVGVVDHVTSFAAKVRQSNVGVNEKMEEVSRLVSRQIDEEKYAPGLVYPASLLALSSGFFFL